MTKVEIISFGYLHGQPPAAHLTVDLREHFRDPHLSPELRYLTAEAREVRKAVMDTPGIFKLVLALETAVHAFRQGPSGDVVRVAIGCAGGRHRSVTVARSLALRVQMGCEDEITITHRDMHLPVVERGEAGEAK